MHEIFIAKFTCLLYEWLKRKNATNTDLRDQEPSFWDWIMIGRLKTLNNKWTRAIDFWFSWVKEGYIIEIVVKYIDSFSEVERTFVKGPQKRLLEEIPLWINMLFMEKGMMHMDPDRMAE